MIISWLNISVLATKFDISDGGSGDKLKRPSSTIGSSRFPHGLIAIDDRATMMSAC